MKTLKRLIKANKVFLGNLLKAGKFYLILQTLFLIFGGFLTYIQVIAPKKFIDFVSNNQLDHAIFCIGFWLSLEIINNVFNNIVLIFKIKATTEPKIKVKESTVNKINSFYLNYFENPEAQNNVSRALQYAENGGVGLIDFIFSILSTVISLCTITYISINFDWWFISLIIFVFSLKTVIGQILKKKDFNFNKEKVIRNRMMGYYSSLMTFKENLQEAKIFNSQKIFSRYYRNTVNQDKEEQINYLKKRLPLTTLENGIYHVFQIFAYSFIGYRIVSGLSTIGDYTLFFSMISNIYLILNKIGNIYSNYYSMILETENYWDLMDDTKFSISTNSLKKCKKINSIVLKNIEYTYPGQTFKAIDNVSFEITRGQVISIVGYNGSGKTTLIKLLLGLYKADKGEIFINNTSINELELKEYWKQTSVVFQNYNIYAFTVKENIELDNKNIKKSVFNKVLSKIELIKKIENLPEKFNSIVTRLFDDNGIDFSGGERQKIAIARTLVRNATLLVFDEPSSALDPVAEQCILETIMAKDPGKMVILISHRLSNIEKSDKILFMKNGKIIGFDSHKELFENCHEYKQYYCSQNSTD